MPSPRPLLWPTILLLLTACGTNDRTPMTGHTSTADSTAARVPQPRARKMIKATDPNMYRELPDDREMQLAIAKARFNFPRFDSALTSGKYDPDLYMLKVRFPTPSMNDELIWFTDITKVNGHYKGVVANTPYEATQIQEGDTLMINDADITDWIYGNDTLVHGAYTTRLILSRMTPAQRDKQELGYTHHIED